MPPNTVYVGRGSRWGNPFRVGMVGIPDSAAAVSAFKRIINRSEHDQYFVFTQSRIRADLAGKNLACWCPPDSPCHADILLEIANAEGTEED